MPPPSVKFPTGLFPVIALLLWQFHSTVCFAPVLACAEFVILSNSILSFHAGSAKLTFTPKVPLGTEIVEVPSSLERHLIFRQTPNLIMESVPEVEAYYTIVIFT